VCLGQRGHASKRQLGTAGEAPVDIAGERLGRGRRCGVAASKLVSRLSVLLVVSLRADGTTEQDGALHSAEGEVLAGASQASMRHPHHFGSGLPLTSAFLWRCLGLCFCFGRICCSRRHPKKKSGLEEKGVLGIERATGPAHRRITLGDGALSSRAATHRGLYSGIRAWPSQRICARLLDIGGIHRVGGLFDGSGGAGSWFQTWPLLPVAL